MEIELKNVKHTEWNSEETACFQATLYVDGKRVCVVSNQGRGGPDSYTPLPNTNHGDLRKKIKEINAELGKTKEKCFSKELPLDLEIVVAEALDKVLRDKEINKILKKIAYIDGNNTVFNLPAKYKPTSEACAKIKLAGWWEKDYRLLNEMNIEEIRKIPMFMTHDEKKAAQDTSDHVGVADEECNAPRG